MTLSLAAVGLLALVSAHALRARTRLERRARALEHELASLQAVSPPSEDHAFLADFLHEFPRRSRELWDGSRTRDVPGAVLNIVMRSFQPRQAVVLVRRRGTQGEPGRGRRLVVAATGGSPTVPLGTEVELGQGVLGFVAETRRVVNREDLDAMPAFERGRLASGNPAGLDPDLAAPILVDDETVGLVAVAGAGRCGADAKAALRLVAQTGAEAMRWARAHARVQASVDVDALTGVFNKRHVQHVLAEAVFAARERLEKLSVLIFDVDHFRNYNDRNGHVAGDLLLRELAGLARSTVRDSDVLGRVGDAQFLVLLPRTSLDPALMVAHKIRAAVAAHGFPHAPLQPLGRITLSGGVAEFPGDALDGAGLLRAADTALEAAKRQGRDAILAADRRFPGAPSAPRPLAATAAEAV